MTSCFVSGSSSLLWRVRSSLAVTRERRSCRVVRRRGLVVKAHSGAIWEEGKEADCCGSSEISIFSKGKKINHVHRNHSDHDHDHEHEHGHDNERSHADHYDGGNHALSHNSIPRSTFGFVDTILRLREDMRIAYASTALLIIGFGFKFLGGPALAVSACVGSVVALSGIPNLVQTVRTLLDGKSNVDVLMTMAALASMLSGARLEGALLLVLYTLSHAAEHNITDRAKGDLDAIKDLSPETAYRLNSANGVVQVPVGEVLVDDVLLVKAGEVLPCDGVVTSGSAFVSMTHITGETTPKSIAEGDEIPAGARPLDGSITVRVLRIGDESTLSRIVRLVTEARKNRPQLQRFIDRFGEGYSKLILSLSFGIALLLPIVLGFMPNLPQIAYGGVSGSISRALGVLVAASPCALVLGAPVAYLSALSACARNGVLVKGGARTIEAASKINQVVFDKTGTLTTGTLALVDVEMMNTAAEDGDTKQSQATKEWAIATGASLEQHVVHPIATALIEQAEKSKLPLLHVRSAHSFPGEGLEGTVLSANGGKDSVLRIGKPSFVKSGSFNTDSWLSTRSELASDRGEIVAALASDSGDAALFRFQDVVRSDAKNAITSLRQHVRVSMLTGDRLATATSVAGEVGGLDHVYSDLSPEDKLTLLSEWKGENWSVMMVGDGVNDAPALAGATVGCAMGLQSATAVHYADVVIVESNISDVDWFLRKCRSTQAIVLQNLILALGIMIITSTAATTGIVPLWLAVSLHEGGTLLVGLNGLRLLSDQLS